MVEVIFKSSFAAMVGVLFIYLYFVKIFSPEKTLKIHWAFTTMINLIGYCGGVFFLILFFRLLKVPQDSQTNNLNKDLVFLFALLPLLYSDLLFFVIPFYKAKNKNR
jgi:Na+/melibiose symporter-like transporter